MLWQVIVSSSRVPHGNVCETLLCATTSWRLRSHQSSRGQSISAAETCKLLNASVRLLPLRSLPWRCVAMRNRPRLARHPPPVETPSPPRLPGIAAYCAPAQQADKNAPEVSTEDTSTTFKVKVNLVEVRVVVRDAQGHAVGNLKQEDFQLLDNGKPQIISRFTVEKAGPKPPPVIQQEPLAERRRKRRYADPAEALHCLSLRRHPSGVSRSGAGEKRGRAPSSELAADRPGRHLHHLRPDPTRLHR